MSTAITKPDVKQFETRLAKLKAEAAAIVVKDAASCLVAKTAQRDLRNEMKAIHLVLDPFVNSAKMHLQEAKDELNKHIEPREAIDDALTAKVKTYEREEREKAQREQDRINAENARIAREKAEADRIQREKDAKEKREARVKEIDAALKAGDIGKREHARMLREAGAFEEAANAQAAIDAEAAKNAPPPAVTVKPNIPTVSGVPSRVNWRFRIVDSSKIAQEYWMVDEQKIGAEVRRIKDKAKAEGQIGGIEVYQD